MSSVLDNLVVRARLVRTNDNLLVVPKGRLSRRKLRFQSFVNSKQRAHQSLLVRGELFAAIK
jgi:hypothetical protein